MSTHSTPVEIRRLEYIDLPFVVEQHQHYFPHGFFARLGSRFLTRYYLTYCTSNDAVALVAISGGDRAGYLVGTTRSNAHRQHVLRWHRSALAIQGFLGLLSTPSLLPTFLRTRALLYARKVVGRPHARSAKPEGADVAILHHLVVLPEYRGRGIGARLIAELEEAARHAGRTSLVLVTEAEGLGAWYYTSTGWDAEGDHVTRDGLRLTTYTREIAPLKAAPMRREEIAR